ncbi:MAG TPA: hypothetical protein VF747_06575 [Blastocatellia bacterium]|jgi:hypothetical protein
MPAKQEDAAELRPTSVRLSDHTRALLAALGKKYGSQGVAVTLALELLAREPYRNDVDKLNGNPRKR